MYLDLSKVANPRDFASLVAAFSRSFPARERVETRAMGSCAGMIEILHFCRLFWLDVLFFGTGLNDVIFQIQFWRRVTWDFWIVFEMFKLHVCTLGVCIFYSTDEVLWICKMYFAFVKDYKNIMYYWTDID